MTVDLVLLLDRPDTLSGATFPLRVVARTTPPLPNPRPVIDALEAAIGEGQQRYHLGRDEMPDRRAAVEQAARRILTAPGGPLVAFELLSLEPVSDPASREGP